MHYQTLTCQTQLPVCFVLKLFPGCSLPTCARVYHCDKKEKKRKRCETITNMIHI